MWDGIKCSDVPVTGDPEDGAEIKSTGIFKEVRAKNLPKSLKNNKTATQEAQRTKTLIRHSPSPSTN